jgi:methyl-accepting chemotaxis protein
MAMDARLANKLRLSTFALLAFVLLGSFAAYVKMVQVSHLSEQVAAERIPALNAVRDLRVSELGASTSLKSYVLFGSDPAMAQRYSEEIQTYRNSARETVADIARLRPTYDSIVGADKMNSLLDQYHQVEASEKEVQTLAIGQGSDGTSKAFDLLQGQVATQKRKLHGRRHGGC